MAMRTGTAQRESFDLVGLSTRASNDDPRPIGALWGRSGELRGEVAGALDDDLWAVYCEYESDHTRPYTFFLGRRVGTGAAAPAGLARRTVPAGTYAVVPAHGPQPATLIATWQAIWAMPLDRTYVADVERHPADDPERVEILVGVRPPRRTR